MLRMVVLAGLGAGVLLATGCIGAESKACGPIVCPKGFTCATVAGESVCTRPWQHEACAGQSDGARCDDPDQGASGFHCVEGVCLAGVCGDGVVDSTEECDDGALNADDRPDACRTSCRLARCGDGVRDPRNGESCDDGAANSDTTPGACRTNCAAPGCGDNVIDASLLEVCDDGNQEPGDGCSADCRSREVCGNGIIDVAAGEACDDGNTTAGDGCGPTCQPEICGNGIVDPGELCDDGNVEFGDGCSPDCRSDERCGTGRVDYLLGEQCDDGNAQSFDGCASGCLSELPGWQRLGVAWKDRKSHGLAFDTVRGRAVLFGGNTINGLDNATWVYEAGSWRLVDTPGRPSAREQFAMAYDSWRDRVVLHGGDDVPVGTLSNDQTWAFDGKTWTRLTTIGPTTSRVHHKMVFDDDRGVMVLWGGYSSVGFYFPTETWELDDVTWAELSTASAPPALEKHMMAYDSSRGRVVLFGGSLGGQSFAYSDQTWEYDGVDWQEIVPATSRPSERHLGAMTYDAVRRVVVLFGGFDPTVVPAVFDDTWTWDGTDWAQEAPTTAPDPRIDGRMVYDSRRGRIVLVGGDTGATPAGVWEWDGSATDWQATPPLTTPSARTQAKAAYDRRRGQLVLLGGHAGARFSAPAGDMWIHDGASWRRLAPPVLPAPRSEHAMVYAADRDRLVLFGGIQHSTLDLDPAQDRTYELDDTWEWDGARWSRIVTATAPTARGSHAMAFDEDRGVVVLFGGTSSTGFLADTWEYDGTDWTDRAPPSAPQTRAWSSMAYDASRLVTVLFGGGDVFQHPETWEWNGTSWAQLGITSPQRRSGAALFYHAARRRVVLFGGIGSASVLDDTWEFDGLQWRQIAPVGLPPPPTDFMAYAYDQRRHRGMIFGGEAAGVGVTSETHVYAYLSVAAEEICGDGVDNDGDGQTDCSDPDCTYAAACLPRCGDGVCDADEAGCACPADCGAVTCPATIQGALTAASPGEYSDGRHAVSCLDYRYPLGPYRYRGSTGDGIYRLDPDGPGGAAPFGAYCDMTTDGGGWTLLFNEGPTFDPAGTGVVGDGCYQTQCTNRAYATVGATRDLMIDVDGTAIVGGTFALRTIVRSVHLSSRRQLLRELFGGVSPTFVEAEDNGNVTNVPGTSSCGSLPWADWDALVCGLPVITLNDNLGGGCGPATFAIGGSNSYDDDWNNCGGWPQNPGTWFPSHVRAWAR